MGRPFLKSTPHHPRSFLNLRYRIAIVSRVLVFLQWQHLYLAHRESLAAKYSLTSFKISPEDLAQAQRRLDGGLRFQQDLIANRASWTVLGEGFEGKVFVYKDSVIKTFAPRSPLRNCAPGKEHGRWPTEIPASLFFGGTFNSTSTSNHHPINDANSTSTGFLPVQAFFKASTLASHPAEWHLVTPLLEPGNLKRLAKTLRTNQTSRSFRQRDASHRPAFNRLLHTLHLLHTAGYCHDDIKPANIFVRDTTHWVLGDLGNVRNISHPYHSSQLWRDNEQLDDCRANDAVRAMKSYLKFIRSSGSDADTFDAAFYGGQEPMSRLYWGVLGDAKTMSAVELRRRSMVKGPEAVGGDGMFSVPVQRQTVMGFFAPRRALRRAVRQALLARMGDLLARCWGMVWLFGMPVFDIC